MENRELKLNTIKNISTSIIEKDYINIGQMARSLGYKKHPEQKQIEEIIDFCQQNNIEVIQTEAFINRNKLFFKSSDVDTFLEKYISADSLVKTYGITYRELYKIRIKKENRLTPIHTRHIAFVNLMLQGIPPIERARLGGQLQHNFTTLIILNNG